MFRISHYMESLLHPRPLTPTPTHTPSAPVVIWNLTRRCNLTCEHCYSLSTDRDFHDELTTQEIFAVMQDLRAFGVPVLILSGGEPLLRPDLFEITAHAKALGFYVGLSTNGTLIDAALALRVRDAGYNYVGISLDGISTTHDRFRRKPGAFDTSLRAIRLLRTQGIKVGLRFTLTQDNAAELPNLLQLLADEKLEKFYLSHLNYAGRGNKNRHHDAYLDTTRRAMDLMFETCLQEQHCGIHREYVTGNNDADGVYLYLWAQQHFPNQAENLRAHLEQWGGNASGVNIANIDNCGQVHPDTFWWDHNLGDVRVRPFSAIWQDLGDPIMAGLKTRPRRIGGRCGVCAYFAICGGNTRVRARQLTGDTWAADPGCYLSDAEIGLTAG